MHSCIICFAVAMVIMCSATYRFIRFSFPTCQGLTKPSSNVSFTLWHPLPFSLCAIHDKLFEHDLQVQISYED